IRRSWTLMLTPKKERGEQVPAISSIIKAGDEGVYSSLLFNNLHEQPGQLALETIHDAFARQLSSRPERSSYPPELSRLMSDSRNRVRRAQSTRVGREARPNMPPRKSMDSAGGLNRALSRRTTAPVLISSLNPLPSPDPTQTGSVAWTRDLRPAQYIEGKTAIGVTAEEVTALSVALGTPLTRAEHPADQEKASSLFVEGEGAHGISVSSIPLDNKRFHIVLNQHKRRVARFPAKGSGYSSLFAKHMAAGSLPFSQDNAHVNSVLIDTRTYELIKTGRHLHAQLSSTGSSGSAYLSALPSSRKNRFYSLTEAKKSTPSALFLNAIADLPFTGGLVPHASSSLTSAIHFVTSAGLPPARLLQRLEALVDKVHAHSPHLALFGPLFEPQNAGLRFREQDRLGRLALDPSTPDSLADKSARMHRYITLLERLMALVPGLKPHAVLAAVREATRKEIERSYEDALALFRTNNAPVTDMLGFPSGLPTNVRHTSYSTIKSRSSKRSSIGPTSPRASTDITSLRSSLMFPAENLGKEMESLLKASLPFDVAAVAKVARLVVVAWTVSVQRVGWEEGEEGVRL
ncbi:hypothetical protein EJ04DRAFT_402942, partial [Polyplosphaeria fusca]